MQNNNDDVLSKQEIFTLVEVMTKNATNLENISNYLEKVTINLDKISTRLYNGLAKEIVSEIIKTCGDCSEETKDQVKTNRSILESIKGDTYWLKIILGSVTFIGLLAQLLIQHGLGK